MQRRGPIGAIEPRAAALHQQPNLVDAESKRAGVEFEQSAAGAPRFEIDRHSVSRDQYEMKIVGRVYQ